MNFPFGARHGPGSHRVIKATASDGSDLFYVAEHTALGNGFLGIMDGVGTSKVFITATGNSYFNGGNVAIDGDLTVSGAYKGDIGPNNGAPFPRPAYNSGWVAIAQDSTITLTHNIGGTVDNYVVDMQFKDTVLEGINNRYIGTEAWTFGDSHFYYGACWRDLAIGGIQIWL
jgi:hypothetical protein